MKKLLHLCVVIAFCSCAALSLAQSNNDTIPVNKTNDFIIEGSGKNTMWENASWIALDKIDTNKTSYQTKFKILYSTKGIYVLFDGSDNKITSTYQHDFENLFNADVYEVFFHPQPSTPLYFEYEISPLDKELVLLIPNLKGRINGWTPWHYEGERKVMKAINIKEAEGKMIGWTAELFFPFKLLEPLENNYPSSGTIWHANFCRLDYDSGRMIKWSWSPIKVSFHEFLQFKKIKFN